MIRKLPNALASTVEPEADGRLFAPSAARNVAPLTALLAAHAPSKGRALEIASGTGQHVVAYADAMPGLSWQPTEPDPVRRRSIDAYAAQSGHDRIAPATELNATAPGWGADWAGQDLIVLSNLLHLISVREAACLIAEAGVALAPGGVLILYGPFRRDGQLTSEGDASFDARLRAEDPEIGYKDDAWVAAHMQPAGLQWAEPVAMPANNLACIGRR